MSDFIERVRALDKAATRGPWRSEDDEYEGPAVSQTPLLPGSWVTALICETGGLNDAEFIAAARTMLPAAVEALAAVRALHRKSETWTRRPRWARETHADVEPYRFCVECRDTWPCATYEATEVKA